MNVIFVYVFVSCLFTFLFSLQDDPNENQHLDYYYYDDPVNTAGYSDRRGDFYSSSNENLTPEYIYYDYHNDMDQKIRDIRKNDAIFR